MDKQNLFLETPQDHFANYEKLLEQVSNFTFLKNFSPKFFPSLKKNNAFVCNSIPIPVISPLSLTCSPTPRSFAVGCLAFPTDYFFQQSFPFLTVGSDIATY